MSEKISFIPARLKNSVIGGHVTGTADVIDDVMGKTQDVINDEVRSDITEAQQDIDTIEEKIPSEASSTNKLADKAYVDTLVATEEERAKAAENANTNAIALEASRATGAEQILQGNIDAENTRALAAESALQSSISAEQLRAIDAEQTIAGELNQEVNRAKAAEEANANSISSETERAQSAESTLQTNINRENTRATGVEATLQSNIEAEETRAKSAENTIAGNLSLEETRAKAAERQNSDDIASINSKIPSQASDTNQLADKDFVNSSVSTATAEFKGTYNSLAELEAVTANLNDYGFVVSTDTAGNTVYNRYKHNGTSWLFEYALNNSSFTAAQWATINSLLTLSHKDKLDALPTAEELTALFDGKQDVISDLETIRQGAALGATAYQKPSGGIPSTDMTSEVQTSLSKADSSYQKPSAGIPSSDMTEQVRASLGLADTAYQKPSTGISTDDLSESVNSSLNKAESAYQKPVTGIPASDMENGVQTSLGKADTAYQLPQSGIAKSDLASDVQTSLGKADTALQEHQSLDDYYTKTDTDDLLAAKQETLVSGTNIKTVNNQSLLGSGNITIESGSTVNPGDGIDITNDVVSVKAGENLSFDENGNLKATDTTYDVFTPAGEGASSGLVPAPRSIVANTRFLCEDGTWKVPDGGGGGYELPIATDTVLGGVKIGDGLSCDMNGVLSVTHQPIFKKVYVGTGAVYTDAMIAANYHETLDKGEPISVSSSATYLWVILPTGYNPTVLMEGIKMPMTAQSDITVDSTVYKVLKSNVTYTGDYNAILL